MRQAAPAMHRCSFIDEGALVLVDDCGVASARPAPSSEKQLQMGEFSSPPVKKRQVIHIGGFDPVDADRLHHRMVNGLGKLAELWNIRAKTDAPEISADGRVMSWRAEAGGPNWSTATDFTLLRWDDFIAFYMSKPRWRKILEGYRAILHFTLNGTVLRYFAANGRYGMFVLYPFFLMIGFVLATYFFGAAVAGLELPFAGVFGVAVGLMVFVAFLTWVGPYFHLDFALADWSFAADLARNKVAGLAECIDQFADEIVGRVRNCGCDEVVLSGVSLGAVMMVEALARALDRDPDLGRRQPDVTFMTIGSSILKIGLHPRATGLKASVAKVAGEESVQWIEYQSKVDPINFFGTDPVEQMGLPPTGKPIVRTMRIRETMQPEEYRVLIANFLRLHRQFAMPNSRRYFYDFYLICFGPMSLADRVILHRRATAAIGEDGSYQPVAPTAGRAGMQVAT